ncbi:MAG: lysophospholipid acyltransferase family protein [Nitrospiraceae bacterium]|nr:lysophospholipid acyltransferase family protein [Nitrospiraceae bacterium]
MQTFTYQNGTYRTADISPSLLAKFMPSVPFYADILSIVFRASSKAKRGKYGDSEWCDSSLETARALEKVGVTIEVTGMEKLASFSGPCVFIGNHMSTLETFVLPTIIEPIKNVTFVVKQSLVEYPVFKYVMRTRDPITVGRTNPREDLKAVFEGGTEKLKSGQSIIVFPQTTRSRVFEPAEFNTIGVKLAKRAGVPVVPIALLTDAWGNGRMLKDFGKIDPSKKVHFAFGDAMPIANRGDEEHQKIVEFISGKLKEWGGEVKGAI